jgi:predicted nucleic-acid-binding protein
VIGLDTNVLVSFLIQSEHEQTSAAAAFLRQRCTRESPCLVNRIVLVEMVWVLETAGYGRAVIADVLERLCRAAELRIEDGDAALLAVRRYREGEADFSDYYLGQVNRRLGCESTATFDKRAAGVPQFELIRAESGSGRLDSR